MTGHPWDNPDANPLRDVQEAARKADPGYLFDASDTHVPKTELTTVHWISLGEPDDCSCGAFHRDPGRPPAEEEHRPHTARRYPAPARSRLASWTIGDALRFLDPVPPRRTLSRWLAAMTPDGEAALPQGGRPARTYPAKAIMERHARWVARGS